MVEDYSWAITQEAGGHATANHVLECRSLDLNWTPL